MDVHVRYTSGLSPRSLFRRHHIRSLGETICRPRVRTRPPSLAPSVPHLTYGCGKDEIRRHACVPSIGFFTLKLHDVGVRSLLHPSTRSFKVLLLRKKLRGKRLRFIVSPTRGIVFKAPIEMGRVELVLSSVQDSWAPGPRIVTSKQAGLCSTWTVAAGHGSVYEETLPDVRHKPTAPFLKVRTDRGSGICNDSDDKAGDRKKPDGRT